MAVRPDQYCAVSSNNELQLINDNYFLTLEQEPRSIAAYDTMGFIKLIRDKKTHKLIGGRVFKVDPMSRPIWPFFKLHEKNINGIKT